MNQPAKLGTGPAGAALEGSTGLSSVRLGLWLVAFCFLSIGLAAARFDACVDAAEIAIAALFALRLVSAPRLLRSPMDCLACGWLAAAAYGCARAFQTGYGLHSPYAAPMDGGGPLGPLHMLRDTAAATMAYFAARDPSWTAAGARRRLMPLVAASAGVVLLCAAELAQSLASGGVHRLQAVFTNPNLLGSFLCLAFPAAMAIALATARGWSFRVGVALAGLLGTCLILTQSRAAILGCCAAALFLLLRRWVAGAQEAPVQARRCRVAVAWCVLCGIAAAGALAAMPRTGRFAHSVSDDQRRVAWSAAARIIESNPIAGIGTGGFPTAMQAMHLREIDPDDPAGPTIPALHLHAHDLFLQAWVERGFAGAILVGLLVVLVARRAAVLLADRSRLVDAAACACLIATLVQNVPDYTLWFAPIGLLVWTTLGLMFSAEETDNPCKDDPGSPDRKLTWDWRRAA